MTIHWKVLDEHFLMVVSGNPFSEFFSKNFSPQKTHKAKVGFIHNLFYFISYPQNQPRNA
jgi:hypothetical protein